MARRPRRQKKKTPKQNTGSPKLEVLEPRVLLSTLTVAPDSEVEEAMRDAEAGPGALEFNLDDADAASPEEAVAAESRTELVFVDTGVENYQALVDDLRSSSPEGRTLEVFLLDSARDGIAEISEILSDYQGVDAIHIVSHGSEGAVQLGDAWLSEDTLASHESALAGWSESLTESADLLFYGCDLAAGESGEALIAQVAKLTGADVAASSDLTGAVALGGDWTLEATSGAIETSVALSTTAQAEWNGLLGTNLGTAIWAEKDAVIPQFSIWNGTGFDPEGSTGVSAGGWRIMQGADAPTRDEKIVVGITDGGKISAMMWDGTDWATVGAGSLGGVSESYWWGADVAYESQSGDAVMVWNDDTQAAGEKLRFSVWDGTDWTAADSILAYSGSEPQQLKLVADPHSDEMVLVVSDSNADDHVLVWNGSSWGNALMVDASGTGENDQSGISAAYEAESGDAMVVYGKDNDPNLYYRIWNGTGWEPEGSMTAPTGVTEQATWTTLASDPTSDRIAVSVLTSGASDADVWLSVWDGDAWGAPVLAEQTGTGSVSPNTAVAFESQSGQAIAVYGENGQEALRFRTWDTTNGWSDEQVGPNIGGTPNSLTLESDPGSNEIMLSVQDNKASVDMVLWDGSGWGTVTELESDTGETKNQPFVYLWDSVSAPLNTAPTTTGIPDFSVNEDPGFSFMDLKAHFADLEDPDTALVYTIEGNTNPALFDSASIVSGSTLRLDYAENQNGVTDITIRATDTGGLFVESTFTVTVNPVNDDPTNAGSLPSDLVFLQDTQGKLDLSSIDLNDVDAGSSDLTLTITSANGHLQTLGWPGLTLGGSQSVLILTGNLTDLNDFLNDATAIDYEHATPGASGNNVDLITIEITDNGNTGSGGGATIELGTVNIDVTPSNTAPVNSVPSGQYTAYGTSLVFSAANGNAISISDAESGAAPVQVTLDVAHGVLTLSGTTGLTFTSGGDGSATMTFSGAQTDVNTALDGLTYSPSASYRGLEELQIVTNDLGSGGAGTPLTDSDTVALHVGALVVTNTSDLSNGDTSSVDALTTSDGGDGISLREAILAINASGGADHIYFDVAGGGPHTIALTSALPTITETMVIDGSSEPDFGGTPMVVLNGSGAGAGAHGLTLSGGSDGSTIRGLVIRDFEGTGIGISGSGSHTIAGNYIGTDGTTAAGNLAGIRLDGSANNIIGGTTPADRNVIAGNDAQGILLTGATTTGNVIEGNYIGLDAAGTATFGNLYAGIWIGNSASGNQIGGTAAGSGNVIAGHGAGIQLLSSANSNTIQGNRIGTDYTGTVALGNNTGGIRIYSGAFDNTIGGTSAGAGNLISGNGGAGVGISDGIGNAILGNLIGTDVTGTLSLGNAAGVRIEGSSTGNIIGGTAPGAGNVISGNLQDGVLIQDAATTGTLVQGNYIGTDTSGTKELGNGESGIEILRSSDNIIGGTSAAARNIISGNVDGIFLSGVGATGNVVQGNYIGTDATGTADLGNSDRGVQIESGANDNLIGGIAAGAGNLISGNDNDGVIIADGVSPGTGTTGNAVQGNLIGTDATGAAVIGNTGHGVHLTTVDDNLIGGADPGAGNIIAGSSWSGVLVQNASASGNAILRNVIYGSGGLAIDLGNDGVTGNDIGDGDAGANELQNTPGIKQVLTDGSGSVTIAGVLESTPNTSFRIEFFANTTPDGSGYGEAERYLGATMVTTDATGSATFSVPLSATLAVGEYVTATATVDLGSGDYGSTSEFSENVAAAPAANQAPLADAGGPYTIAEGEGVLFDASGTTDANGDSLTYRWDLDNDGIYGDLTSTSPSVGTSWNVLAGSYGINDDGTYTIGLQVDDGAGGITTTTTTLTVTNVAPVITATGPSTVGEGSVYVLDLSAVDPGADTIATWTINWGDGSITTVDGSATEASHVYGLAGMTYEITVSAADEDGTFTSSDLLTASDWNGHVLLLDGNTGDPEAKIGGAVMPTRPASVAIGPDGDYYVVSSDTNSIIRIDASTGTSSATFVAGGSGGLSNPFGLAFGPDGNLYVASYNSGEVLRYDGATGAFMDVFVSDGEGGVGAPSNVEFGPDGMLYVTDWFTGKVHRFDAAGDYVDDFVNTGGFGTTDVAFGPDGTVFVSNANNNTVFKYDSDGVLLDSASAGSAYQLELGPDGNLYVSRWSSDAIERFDIETMTSLGIFADASDDLDGPWGIEFTPDQQVKVLPHDAPSAEDDTASVLEGGSVVIDLASNDMDGDDPIDPASIAIVDAPANGSIVVHNDGTVTYTHDGSETLADTFSYTIADSTGAASEIAFVKLDVAPVNDAPVLDGSVILNLDPVAEGSGAPVGPVGTLVSSLVDFADGSGRDNVTDADAGAVTGIAVTQAATGMGTWYYSTDDGATWNALVGVTESNALLLGAEPGNRLYFEPNPGFSGLAVNPLNFRAWDQTSGTNGGFGDASVNGGSTAFSAVLEYVSAPVTANQPPTAVNDVATVGEGGSVTIDLAGNDTDPDGTLDLGSIVVTSVPANGTLVDHGDGTFTYTHDGTETLGDSFGYTIQDANGATSNVASVTLTITPVNDLPSVAYGEGNKTYVEDAPPLVIDALATVADPDSGDFAGGTLTFDIAANSRAGDQLGIRNQGTGAGQVGVSGSNVTYGGIVVGTWTGGGDQSTPLVVTFNAAADASAVEAVARNVTFHNTSQTPATSSRTIRMVVTDGDGGTSNAVTKTISAMSVNDTPTGGDDSYSTAEETPLTVSAPGVLANDVDLDGHPITAQLETGPSNGSLVLNADGSFTYTPDADFAGTDSFTYVVRDASSTPSDPVTVTIDVTPINDAPVRTSGTVADLTVEEDSGLTSLGLAGLAYGPGGGADEAGQNLTVEVTVIPDSTYFGKVYLADGTTQVTTGKYTIAELQGMQFEPAADESGGPSFFSFRIYDDGGTAGGGSDFTSESIQIHITPTNDAPVLTLPPGNTSYVEGSVAFVTPSASLTDVDSPDFDGGQLVVTIAAGGEATDRLYVNSEGTGPGQVAASGATVSYSDGSGSVVIGTISGGYGSGDPLVITFNAAATESGVAAVAEQVLFWNTSEDPSATSRTVTMQVTDGDGGASAVQTRTIDVTPQNDAPTAVDDTATVNEGESVTFSLTGNDTDPDSTLNLGSIVITSLPANGTLVDHGDGTFTYTHDGTETLGDSFSYTIQDADGATSNVASVTLTVIAQNDAPTAVDDTATVNEGESVTFSLTGNDSDPDSALNLGSIVITSLPANGTLIDHGDGTFTYTHDGTETLGDSFSYTVQDADGATSNVASVTLTVIAQNDAPTAVDDTATVNEGESVTFSLTGNDTDPDSALNLGSIVITSMPANGTLVDHGDGTFTYTHDGTETLGDSFSYTIQDADGATSNVASVTLTVIAQNDAPTAADDTATVNEGESVTFSLTGNDSDPDSALNLGSIVITSLPANGTLVDHGDGTFTYTHDGTETLGDSFSYTIQDANGATSNVASVTLTVIAQNDAPTAVDDTATVNEGESVTFSLTGNDTDPDSTLNLGSIVITSLPANGTLVDHGDGTFTYTHDGTETLGDSFSYTIRDADGATSNVASVTLTVIAQNDAPTAVDDTATVNEGESVTLSLTGNDSDPDSALNLGSIVITSLPANGTLVDHGDGTFTYTHDGTETLGDSFSYTIQDANGATSNVASVALTVIAQNDAPTAVDDAATVNEGESVTFSLTGNDTDPDSVLNLGSIVITSLPANGTLVDHGDGTFTYTHDGTETLGDSFSYTIQDANGATSNVASVTLTVIAQNDDPLIDDQELAVDENTAAGTLVGSVAASDPDLGDSLAFAITSGNFGGAFAIDPNSGDVFVANPASLDFEATPEIVLVVEVEDLDGARTSANVTVTIRNLNEPIQLSGPDSLSLTAGESVVLSTLDGNAISVSDLDGADAPLEVTLTASGGVLTLGSTDGITILTGTGSADSVITFQGSASAVGAALDGLLFEADGSAGAGSIDVDVADLAPDGRSVSMAVGVDVKAAPEPAPEPVDEPTPEVEPPAEPRLDELTLPEPKTEAPETPETASQGRTGDPTSVEAKPEPAPVQGHTGFFIERSGGEGHANPDWQRGELPFEPGFRALAISPDSIQVQIDGDREARPVVDLLRPAFLNADLFAALDQMRRDVLEAASGDADGSEWMAPALEGMTLAATTGLLAAVLRSGSLMAMGLSSVPLWKRADPLTVLSLSKEEREDLEANLRAAGSAELDLDAVLEGSEEPESAEDDPEDEDQ